MKGVTEMLLEIADKIYTRYSREVYGTQCPDHYEIDIADMRLLIDLKKSGVHCSRKEDLPELAEIKVFDRTPAPVHIHNHYTSSPASYTYIQSVPSVKWYIRHPLKFNPNVTVVGLGGEVIQGQTVYLSPDEIEITFSMAVAGSAYLS